MKKTAWFPDGVNPVREGMYETKTADAETTTYSFWLGYWTAASEDKRWVIQKAAEGQRSFWQQREWRGLTERA